MKAILKSYLELTKPTIMLLVIFTGGTSLILEGSLLADPVRFLLVLIGLYLTGGSANALNQVFERELDKRMARTSGRRPLPQGRIGWKSALVFSSLIGLVGVWIFYWYFNLLTALLALGTILFYSLFYTLWLKPNTPQNIVIGGIAGAMAPVGAWTAATGRMDIAPWILFLIIFLWTPPHFWALALFCKDDYRKAKLPMMPLVRGDKSALRQMLTYTVVLMLVSLSLLMFGAGWFYLAAAAILGGLFIRKAHQALKYRTVTVFKAMFGYSILYLFGLFTAMIADRFIS